MSVALIKPIAKEYTPYLKYVLISPLIQNQIKPKGTALKHLYLKDLREFTILIPTLEEQKIIVNKSNKTTRRKIPTKIRQPRRIKKIISSKSF